jgi:hypothetical protein
MVYVKFSASFLRLAFILELAILLEASSIAANINPSTLPPHKKSHSITENQHAKKRMRTLAHSRAPRSSIRTYCEHEHAFISTSTSRHHYYERFLHQFVCFRYH